MRRFLYINACVFATLFSCTNDKDVLSKLGEYNFEKESEGYRMGEAIQLPPNIIDGVQHISLSIGDKEIHDLKITPQYFKLGENAVTFIITTKSGEKLAQDATINVFAKNPEKNLTYQIVQTYPHDANNFVQGFQLEGNTIYESDGQLGVSQMIKYPLGSTTPTAKTSQPADIFSEGATVVGDKVYQLTWQHRKGFIYDKVTLTLQGEFSYPNSISEGWGLAYDGKNLLMADGTKNIYVLNAQNPSQIIDYFSVTGYSQTYKDLNELEYHNGFLYANVWKQPIILKINPKTGEVVGKWDLIEIAQKHTNDPENVLNGIAFKGNNMLVTGKKWDTIYELKVE